MVKHGFQGKLNLPFGQQSKKNMYCRTTKTLCTTDDLLIFLLGILSACKLTMADVAVLNKVKQPGLNMELQAEVILFLDSRINWNCRYNFPLSNSKSITTKYLCAPGLQLLQR